MVSRAPGWWTAAERMCDRLAAPRIDVDAADRQVEAIVLGSGLWSRAAAFASSVHAAWLASGCRRLWRWAAARA